MFSTHGFWGTNIEAIALGLPAKASRLCTLYRLRKEDSLLSPAISHPDSSTGP
jgi:hypothetical protein